MLSKFARLFNSRKFIVFLYVLVSSSVLLATPCYDKQCLPPQQYSELVIWVSLLFFGASVLQRVDPKGEAKPLPPVKLRQKLASQKFVSLVLLFGFLFFALRSGLLPADVYANLIVWVSGAYFGVDVARIYAYRQGKLGAPEYARDEWSWGQQPPPYQDPNQFPNPNPNLYDPANFGFRNDPNVPPQGSVNAPPADNQPAPIRPPEP